MKERKYKRYNPKLLIPRTDDHIKLLSKTALEYERLKWAQTRLWLGGEEGYQVEDPGKPVSPEETPFYVLEAERQGLIINTVRPIPQVQIQEGVTGILLSLQPHGFYFSRELLGESYIQAEKDERFKDIVLPAGIHKLGCMLAVTDQLTFEQRIKENPIDSNYTTSVETEGDLYMALFNEPELPGIHSLYQRAHSLLLSTADPDDPLLQHLFLMTSLPNFK